MRQRDKGWLDLEGKGASGIGEAAGRRMPSPDDFILATAVPDLLPKADRGRKIHVKTVLRYLRTGQLEGVFVGGRWYTTKLWVRRFLLHRKTRKLHLPVAQEASLGAVPLNSRLASSGSDIAVRRSKAERSLKRYGL